MALRGHNPGRLDQKITLLQPTQVTDSTTGAVKESYTTAGTVRAERLFRNATERMEAQQQVGVLTEEFRIRDYRTLYGINERWRFTWDSKTYAVRSIEKVGRKNYLILTGEARDN